MRATIVGLTAVLCISSLGCATRVDKSAYVRDGISYGVTDGTFRGRWWNFYERGRSYLEGRYLDEAEQDFRVALISRGRDQVWARSYGLHFVPEYFPHRELGITYFLKGNNDEAIQELELSLATTYSARAAYYLDEARKKHVTADSEEPTVSLDGALASRPAADVVAPFTGIARDNTYVSKIHVNDEPVLVKVSQPEVRFTHPVRLTAGDNEVTVRVTDLMGNESTTTFTLAADLDGPAVSFDEPIAMPGAVTGVAYDPAGVSALRVAGVEAKLEGNAENVVTFTASIGRDNTSPNLTFEAVDELGNTTRGEVPVSAIALVDRLPETVFASGVRTAQLDREWMAHYVGGIAVGLTRIALAAEGRAPRVRFANVGDADVFFNDRLVVQVDITSQAELRSATLNGEPLQLIPGRTSQRVSRTQPLPEPGPYTLVAQAIDTQGLESGEQVSVVREQNQVERLSTLDVAILGNVWESTAPDQADLTETLAEELKRELATREYESRFTLVAREQMDIALNEQQLSALLASKENRLQSDQFKSADVMFIGKIRADQDTLGIIIEAISTETGEILARPDIEGPVKDAPFLIQDLAVRIAQEFPRVQAKIVRVKSDDSFATTLNEAHGIKRSMKYIVFRYEGGDANAPGDAIPLFTAMVTAVDDRESTARILNPLAENIAAPIGEDCYVVTK